MAKALASKNEEKRGPTVDKAFDASGQVAHAGQGFFRSVKKEPKDLTSIKNGIDPTITIREVKGSDYLFAVENIPGRSAAEILSEQMPNRFSISNSPKKCVGQSRNRLRKALQWVVALLEQT